MALHLDLEEQEQVDQLKHFWKQYGNLISWVLIVVLGSYAAWNGWNYWQRKQAVQAASMYDEVVRVVATKDTEKINRVFADMKNQYGGQVLTQQAGLLVAQGLSQAGMNQEAETVLTWVAGHASDEGVQAIAQLRLAAILLDRKAHDQALQVLKSVKAPQFQALAADRQGDVLLDQGKTNEAKSEYQRALRDLPKSLDYRTIVEAKLNALGVDTTSLEGKK